MIIYFQFLKVFFRTQESKPISILSVNVEPQPHIIDQTFRFHHPEQTFFKKCIRLPLMHTMAGKEIKLLNLLSFNILTSSFSKFQRYCRLNFVL